MKATAMRVLWFGLGVLLTAAVVLVSDVVFGRATLLITPLVLAAAVMGLTVVRQRRARQVLGHVAQAVEMNLPLVAMLRAAAASERGAVARRLRGVAAQLETGSALSRSLELRLPEADARSIASITAGERIGRLREVMRRLREEDDRRDLAGGEVFDWVWPVVELTVGLCIASLLCFFVLPKFQEITRDFFVSPAGHLRWIQEHAELVQQAVVLPAVGWAALVLWLMMRLLRGPRAGRVGRWLRERVMWYTPGLHGLARARGLSDVCFAIEAGLRSGLPLHSAVREAGAVAMSGPLAQRVARWADELEAGREVSEAARRSGLPAMLVGIVSTSRGDLREGLRFLSAYYGSRFSRSVMLVQAAVLPVGTLVVGLVVAGVGMAVFEPLVQWMEAVSDAGGFMP